ncbi:hypothetical protein Tco_0031504 [Tanacetum coccineum]|uniref:Uncharacterized protein n=1 Tax=Tanacetum coccineum TaxID=301880 RepID=A0ABQ4WTR2_9ASTR
MLKRLYIVGLTTQVESSDNEESLGEDASKQRRIDAINADKEITLVMSVCIVGDATTVSAATTTTATITTNKGKGILIEPVKPIKKKDLIWLDEEAALKLQAEFDEEERLEREKAEKEKEANYCLD